MGDYTGSGFWYPTESDPVVDLNTNLRKMAQSSQAAFDANVAVTRVSPASTTSSYVNDRGLTIVTGEEDGENRVRLTGAFDWDDALGYEIYGTFNQCYQNESFSFVFGHGNKDDTDPIYNWSRLITRRGVIKNDWQEFDNGVPLTRRPGSTAVTTHIFKLTIMRADAGSFIHGFVSGTVDRGHGFSHVDTRFDYNATDSGAGNGDPDSITIYATNGGSAYKGSILMHALR